MPFDIKTARPLSSPSGGFDISTAKPLFEKPKPRKDVIDAMTGGKELIPEENWVARGVYQTGKDIAVIPAHFANQFLLNAPRSIASKAGFDYPEAEGGAGDLASKMAGIVGGFKNPLIKAAATAPTLLQGALKSAGVGALYTPTEDPIALGQRATQAAGAAVLPVAGKAISKVGQMAGRGIDYLKKSSADYVTTKVAPKAYKIYKNNVSKFTPYIQRFAKDKLGISEGAINTIKRVGINSASKVRQLYNDSTDAIYQKVEQGFSRVRSEADRAYQVALDNAPEGKKIDIMPAIKQAGSRLQRLGLITKGGNMTELGKSEIARDSVYGKLLDFYKSADSISGVKKIKTIQKVVNYKDIFGGKITYTKGGATFDQAKKMLEARSRTLVNKDQFVFLRDKLNALYKNKPSDIDVSKVVNQFYDDGERAGIKGLQQARSMQRKAFQAEENLYNKPLIKERKLDKFQNLSQAEKRQLMDIEKYTGEKFVDDLDQLTADRALDKLRAYNPERFANDLNKATDRKWTNYLKNEYRDLLGGKADEIFNEVVAHRRGLKIRQGAKFIGGAALGGGIATGIYNKVVH